MRKRGGPPKPCALDECERMAAKRGMCNLHYMKWQRWVRAAGTFEPLRTISPVLDMPDGSQAKRCTRCRQVKHLALFHPHAHCAGGVAAECMYCIDERQQEWMATTHGKKVRARGRIKRQTRDKRVNRAAEAKYAAWAAKQHRTLVDAAVVCEWFAHVTDAEAEALTGIPARSFHRMRHSEQVELVTADRIARAFDRTFELAQLAPPHGRDGWSKQGHRYCGDHPCEWSGGGCGTIWHMHKALGLCANCHQAFQRERRSGRPTTTHRKKRYGT